MANYKTEIFEVTNNPQYTYYKLYVDGKCAFDDFLDEIKKNNIRVYVIDQRPDIYIVMGGYKRDQKKKDIPRLIRKTKDFPKKEK